MVDPETDLVMNSEESQTVFGGQQTLLQPPPVEMEKKKNRKTLIIGSIVFGLFIFLIAVSAYFSSLGGNNGTPDKVLASPTPSSIFIDPQKENELKRIEEIIKNADPEKLIVAPPQVDMTVLF